MNSNLLLLVGRILLSLDFIVAGFFKLTGADGMAGYFGSLGLPAPLAMVYLVGICELVGGLGVLVGFQTRLFAILLGLFCIATGFLAHGADMITLMKNIALAGGFFALAGAGPGAYAVEARTRRTSAYA